jgi:hypothetical protein
MAVLGWDYAGSVVKKETKQFCQGLPCVTMSDKRWYWVHLVPPTPIPAVAGDGGSLYQFASLHIASTVTDPPQCSLFVPELFLHVRRNHGIKVRLTKVDYHPDNPHSLIGCAWGAFFPPFLPSVSMFLPPTKHHTLSSYLCARYWGLL